MSTMRIDELDIERAEEMVRSVHELERDGFIGTYMYESPTEHGEVSVYFTDSSGGMLDVYLGEQSISLRGIRSLHDAAEALQELGATLLDAARVYEAAHAIEDEDRADRTMYCG